MVPERTWLSRESTSRLTSLHAHAAAGVHPVVLPLLVTSSRDCFRVGRFQVTPNGGAVYTIDRKWVMTPSDNFHGMFWILGA
jgi:hypothetical protein